MVNKDKFKGFSFFLEKEFYYYLKRRSEESGVSIACYIRWLISKDIESFMNKSKEKK